MPGGREHEYSIPDELQYVNPLTRSAAGPYDRGSSSNAWGGELQSTYTQFFPDARTTLDNTDYYPNPPWGTDQATTIYRNTDPVKPSDSSTFGTDVNKHGKGLGLIDSRENQIVVRPNRSKKSIRARFYRCNNRVEFLNGEKEAGIIGSDEEAELERKQGEIETLKKTAEEMGIELRGSEKEQAESQTPISRNSLTSQLSRYNSRVEFLKDEKEAGTISSAQEVELKHKQREIERLKKKAEEMGIGLRGSRKEQAESPMSKRSLIDKLGRRKSKVEFLKGEKEAGTISSAQEAELERMQGEIVTLKKKAEEMGIKLRGSRKEKKQNPLRQKRRRARYLNKCKSSLSTKEKSELKLLEEEFKLLEEKKGKRRGQPKAPAVLQGNEDDSQPEQDEEHDSEQDEEYDDEVDSLYELYRDTGSQQSYAGFNLGSYPPQPDGQIMSMDQSSYPDPSYPSYSGGQQLYYGEEEEEY